MARFSFERGRPTATPVLVLAVCTAACICVTAAGASAAALSRHAPARLPSTGGTRQVSRPPLAVAAAASRVGGLAPAQQLLGINLGNVLEAPLEGMWAPPAQEYYFDDYKTAGFNCVRIPVRWDNHTDNAPPYAVNATWMARVEQVAGWCTQRNFSVCMINSHHDDWINVANETQFYELLPRFEAIWMQVAAAFADAPPNLVFEILNEPSTITLPLLNALYAAVIPIIRASNPSRTIFFGGLEWMNPSWIAQNPDSLVLPATDPNLALSVHSYDPYTFTSPPISDFAWGNASDVATVVSMATAMGAWSRQHGGMPVVLGEFATSVLQPNGSARLAWYRAMNSAYADAGVGRLIWDDDGWYMTYNRANRTWDEGVLTSLGL